MHRFVISTLFFCAGLTAQNSWTVTGSMSSPRQNHSLTAVSGGRALAAGGCADLFCNSILASAEIYNGASGTWSSTGSMSSTRTQHSATLLTNGNVLVAAGCTTTSVCNTATGTSEIYNTAAGTWSGTGSMITGRFEHVATLLANGEVLVTGGVQICNSSTCNPLASVEIYSPSSGVWRAVAPMPAPHINHKATLLTSGKVLVTGGCATFGIPCSVANPLLYDPTSNTWTAAGTMANRLSPAQELLVDGRVLVAGGLDSSGFTQKTAQIYDPASNSWSTKANMNVARWDEFSARQTSGAVLVGAAASNGSTESYDPGLDAWVFVGNLNVVRETAPAVALTDGRILVAGGSDFSNNTLSSAELFATGSTPLTSISPTSVDLGYVQAPTQSAPQTVVVTNAGTVPLVISNASFTGDDASRFSVSSTCLGSSIAPGGHCNLDVRFRPLAYGGKSATLNIFDNAPNSPQLVPVKGFGYADISNNFQPAAALKVARIGHTSTRLTSGKILIAGGFNYDSGTLNSAELYDPSTNTMSFTGAMTIARSAHTATLLADGRVLVSGGDTLSAEIYDPSTGTWFLTGALKAKRSGHTATLLNDGSVLVAGGGFNTAETYSPGTAAWTLTANTMSSIRSNHTATLLSDGRVLLAGGAIDSTHYSNTADIYAAGSRQFTSTGSMSTLRSTHGASMLANGQVLITGGFSNNDSPLRSTETYNPATGKWSNSSPLRVPRGSHTVTTMEDGSILAAGGLFYCDPEFGFCYPTATAETYNPNTGNWRSTGPMLSPLEGHTSSLLPTGEPFLAGGTDDFYPVTLTQTFKR